MKNFKSSTIMLTLFVLLWLPSSNHTFAQTTVPVPTPNTQNLLGNGAEPFYKLEVVAESSPTLNIFAAPSINYFGDIAFAGRYTQGGGTVFLNELGQQQSVDLMPGFSSSPNQIVAGRVQINNLKEVIQHSFVTQTNPQQNFLRRINDVNDFTLIAAANGVGSFNDFDQIYPSSISINDIGESVYVTRNGNNTTILTTGTRPNFSTLQFPSSGNSLFPMISENGCIIVRAGASQTDPLRLYSYDLTSFETIASVSDGFTEIGRSSSLSDNCEVIVFYGNLNATGANTLGTNPGQGIFASIEISPTQRRIVRISGRLIEDNSASGGNDDGFCDPGETCIQGELGFNQNGDPIFFNSFDSLNRVAVAHQSAGNPGIEDDTFVTSFLATPNIASDNPEQPFSNQLGLWTVTTKIENENGTLREKPNVAVPVIQIDDVINNQPVTGINVYDQIASVRSTNPAAATPSDPTPTTESPGDHRLAFHITTNVGSMIIRAGRNVDTPVIFIPGITGSTLVEGNTERWVGVGVGLLTGANFDRLIPSNNANIKATDAIRSVNIAGIQTPKTVYKEILDTLRNEGGLTEYQVTSQGCDLTQKAANPMLFVFAYDWRKSNIENAQKLKDYIDCVQEFYPNTKVDIVAHSMGGLLARRHIIANPNDHSVRKFISIGSPFLGATKGLSAIETGRLGFLPDFVEKRIPSFVTNRVKKLAKESDAVHELLPSEAFFTLGGQPFVEETFDINGNGTSMEIYNYSQTKNLFNSRFSTLPYNANETFHGSAGQDDWRQDTSGVEYFHIIGEQKRPKTTEQIIATPIVRKPLSIIDVDFDIEIKTGFGDGTVPSLSAERIGNGLNYNFPNATLFSLVAENRNENSRFSHLGLVKAPEVREKMLEYLDLPSQPLVSNLGNYNGGNQMPSYEYKANSGQKLEDLRGPGGEGYYVKIIGVERLNITDDLGNTNTPIGDMGFELSVPDVSYFGGFYNDQNNKGNHGLDMPADEGEYTIKFTTESNSIDIEVLKGVGNRNPNLAIRYIDLELPLGVECLMTFNPQGVPDLRYDSNGDGTYDTVVTADVRVTGANAQDVTAPAVTITAARKRVTIDAIDTESGVKTIYYRIGETGSFKVYTGTFLVPSLQLRKPIEAFADDNVGNRSSPVSAITE